MSNKNLTVSDELHDYILRHGVREDDLQRRLREETATLSGAGMQIAPEQGQFMRLLIHLINARKALEIGVFTGYSSLAVALALPPDGRLVACDIDPRATAVARRYWEDAGVADKIDLRLGPALETLAVLRREEEVGTFDFAFIDADKGNYERYFQECLELVRPGGLIMVDNVLWSGRVADEADNEKNTRAIRAFNSRIADDDRVESVMLPVADGITLARKL